jgi:hypothetical protein
MSWGLLMLSLVDPWFVMLLLLRTTPFESGKIPIPDGDEIVLIPLLFLLLESVRWSASPSLADVGVFDVDDADCGGVTVMLWMEGP